MKKYVGDTIYLKDESDRIKQIISGKQYATSHQNIYGTPAPTKQKPILSSKYGYKGHNQARRVSYQKTNQSS